MYVRAVGKRKRKRFGFYRNCETHFLTPVHTGGAENIKQWIPPKKTPDKETNRLRIKINFGFPEVVFLSRIRCTTN